MSRNAMTKKTIGIHTLRWLWHRPPTYQSYWPAGQLQKRLSNCKSRGLEFLFCVNLRWKQSLCQN